MSNNLETRGHEAAFPEINHDNPQFNTPTYGLTKREYFAAMRKEPIFCDENVLPASWAKLIMGSEPPEDQKKLIIWWVEAHERFAVMKADALIKALNENQQP